MSYLKEEIEHILDNILANEIEVDYYTSDASDDEEYIRVGMNIKTSDHWEIYLNIYRYPKDDYYGLSISLDDEAKKIHLSKIPSKKIIPKINDLISLIKSL